MISLLHNNLHLHPPPLLLDDLQGYCYTGNKGAHLLNPFNDPTLD